MGRRPLWRLDSRRSSRSVWAQQLVATSSPFCGLLRTPRGLLADSVDLTSPQAAKRAVVFVDYPTSTGQPAARFTPPRTYPLQLARQVVATGHASLGMVASSSDVDADPSADVLIGSFEQRDRQRS